ncbi:MAG: hypothetical protein JXA01_09005 [Dehalococcoidia bacterium]|nr:hypothetical protein [Dehalococcoidia bacterium]
MNRLSNTGEIVLVLVVTVFSICFGCLLPQQPSTGVQIENHAPVIESISHVKDVFSNVETQLACLASDADGDNLTYRWSADAGDIMGEGANILWMPPDKLGTYNVVLVVADGKGGEARETINIRVVTNADGSATPRIEIKLKLGETQPVVIEGQRSRIWMTTDIACIVENAGKNQLTYTWLANGGKIAGGGLEEGKADRIGWTAPGVQSDSVIKVVVTDSQGRSAAGQVNIHVFCCGN